VFSLQEVNGSDFLVTAMQAESNHLQQRGTYRELCASSLGDYGSDLFCYTPGMTSFAARQGPFLLFTLPTPPPVGAASSLHADTPRHPLYRCNTRGTHSVQTDSTCRRDGDGVMEQLLGYASSAPHTGMPRRLWACVHHDGAYTVLDADCLEGHAPHALGWVM
jgi:hypothetical protein